MTTLADTLLPDPLWWRIGPLPPPPSRARGGAPRAVPGPFVAALMAAAVTRPASHPGARPPAGGLIALVGRPLRASSHEITELEFHISPVPSSSRPQTGSAGRQPGRAGDAPRVGRRSGAGDLRPLRG